MKRVVVVDYDPGWASCFERVHAYVWPGVSDVAIGLEHVGSTSVPGLAAKPVIDMDLIVAAEHQAESIERLARLGYAHRGDLGIPRREAFRAPEDLPRHHLYLCPPESPALANHLAVRDHLRATPDDAQAYGALKKSLAAAHPRDIDAYMEGKSSFLLEILRKSGFDAEALADIERFNRRTDR